MERYSKVSLAKEKKKRGQVPFLKILLAKRYEIHHLHHPSEPNLKEAKKVTEAPSAPIPAKFGSRASKSLKMKLLV